MSGMTCLACYAETTNGLALCEMCQRKAGTIFEFLPVYFRNLARWRPGRAGSRPVPGSRVLYDGETRGSDRITRALDEASNALTTWARMLADDRCLELPTADTEAEEVAALCGWFSENLTSIATLEWCGEFMRDDHREGEEFDGISYHERKLRALTEKVAPGWYAGACRRCGVATYVVPGLTWVTCGACGATTYARDHLEAVVEEAREWVATPKRLAEAIVAMVDSEESIDSLRKRIAIWGNRNKLEVCRPHAYAIKRYRMGDVLDLILAQGPTRTGLLPREADAC